MLTAELRRKLRKGAQSCILTGALPLCGGNTESTKIEGNEKERELYKEMNINGVHVEVYISNTPSDGSMRRVIENLLAAYEERIAKQ